MMHGRPRVAVLAVLLATAIPASAAAPACGNGLPGETVLRGEHLDLAWAPVPAPLATGRHFALDVVVCPHAGEPAPDALRADARMPEHGHGMNYAPTAQRLDATRWRVEGLMLHMAGRWELGFELQQGGRTLRLVQGVQVR